MDAKEKDLLHSFAKSDKAAKKLAQEKVKLREAKVRTRHETELAAKMQVYIVLLIN